MKFNGLDSQYNYFQPGSDAALSAAFTSAFEKGEPIVGYYWEPTWLTGKYDMVLLEDYPMWIWRNTKPERPLVRLSMLRSASATSSMEEEPEFCEFLEKYETSSALTSEALAYMQDNEGVTYTDTAKWF